MCSLYIQDTPLYDATLNASSNQSLPRGWHVPKPITPTRKVWAPLPPHTLSPSSSVALITKAAAKDHCHLDLPRLKRPHFPRTLTELQAAWRQTCKASPPL